MMYRVNVTEKTVTTEMTTEGHTNTTERVTAVAKTEDTIDVSRIIVAVSSVTVGIVILSIYFWLGYRGYKKQHVPHNRHEQDLVDDAQNDEEIAPMIR